MKTDMNYLKKFLIVCVQMALTLPAWGGNTEAKDPIINPVPHEVEMSAEETALDVTTGVRITWIFCRPGIRRRSG